MNQQQKMQYHPLCDDSLFVPNDLKHVIFQQPIKEAYSRIVVPVEHDKVHIEQIQPQITGRVPDKERMKKIFGVENNIQRHRYEVEKAEMTLSEYKVQNGRKRQNIQEFQLMQHSVIKKTPYGMRQINQSRYQICMIMLKNFDVFAINIRWSQNVSIESELLHKINKLYSSTLVIKDIDITQLGIEIIQNKNYESFRFKRITTLNEDSLKQLVFGQVEPAFIGIDINTSKFKERKPNKLVLYEGIEPPKIKSQLMGSAIKVISMSKMRLQQKPRIIQIQLTHKTKRVNYFEVKQYKVKFLLGLLGQPQYDRKGLTVLNKAFRPDDEISDMADIIFMSDDANFIQAQISSQKQLFYQDVNNERPMNVQQISQVLQMDKNIKSKIPCLSAYFNQARYPRIQKEKQALLTQALKNFIHNYFIEYHTKQTLIFKCVLKTLLKEIESLQTFKGWVFRAVNYEYNKKELQYISFSNILVTTKNYQKVQFRLDPKLNCKSTLFRIKSVSGKLAHGISLFSLQEVLYPPYTSFQIITKVKKNKITQYQLEEAPSMKADDRANVLIWVDDKPKQCRELFQMLKTQNIAYPIYFYQVASNAQFERTVTENKSLFQSPNIRKIIVSNMKRKQNEKIVDSAGADTHLLANKLFGRAKVSFLYFIGNKQGTIKKLNQKGIDQKTCLVTSCPTDLINNLIMLCNWENNDKDQQGSYNLGLNKLQGNPYSAFNL